MSWGRGISSQRESAFRAERIDFREPFLRLVRRLQCAEEWLILRKIARRNQSTPGSSSKPPAIRDLIHRCVRQQATGLRTHLPQSSLGGTFSENGTSQPFLFASDVSPTKHGTNSLAATLNAMRHGVISLTLTQTSIPDLLGSVKVYRHREESHQRQLPHSQNLRAETWNLLREVQILNAPTLNGSTLQALGLTTAFAQRPVAPTRSNAPQTGQLPCSPKFSQEPFIAVDEKGPMRPRLRAL